MLEQAAVGHIPYYGGAGEALFVDPALAGASPVVVVVVSGEGEGGAGPDAGPGLGPLLLLALSSEATSEVLVLLDELDELLLAT